MKKVVLKMDIVDDKVKQKAMKTVSGLKGVESIAMDMKEKKLTIIGDIDPVSVVGKLRKVCRAEIVSVGPAKEEPKKDDKKKEEPKKEEGKKEEGKKDEPKKDEKKDEAAAPKPIVYPAYHMPYYPQQLPYFYQHQQQAYAYQQPQVPSNHYYARSAEEDPNSCVIC